MTSAHVSFEARIEPVAWGEKTHTVLRLPPEAVALTRAERVEGEIAEHPVNLAVVHAEPVDGAFVWAGKNLLARNGAQPGETVEVRLRPVDPFSADLPGDLAAALLAAGRSALWHAATPGKRRGWRYRIDMAKRADTRARRIAELVAALDIAAAPPRAPGPEAR